MAEHLDDASVFPEPNAEAFTMAPFTLQRMDVAIWEQMPHIQTLCVRRSPFPMLDEVSLIPLSLGLTSSGLMEGLVGVRLLAQCI